MSSADEPAPVAASHGRAVEAMAAITARAGYMMGDKIEQTWAEDDAVAWEGLLEAARTFRRGAEAALEQHHELSISMLGVMGRLVRAPQNTLRQTDLADAMGLSLSRISRIIDILETRGFVKRQRCPSDARATNVTLTPTGRTRTIASQDTIYGYVNTLFIEQLTEAERTTLAAVFTRLLTQSTGTADGNSAV